MKMTKEEKGFRLNWRPWSGDSRKVFDQEYFSMRRSIIEECATVAESKKCGATKEDAKEFQAYDAACELIADAIRLLK